MKMIKLALFVLGCIFAMQLGCDEVNRPELSAGLTHPLFKQSIADPGALHNRLAQAYALRRSGKPITRREFVTNMVEAANDVLREEGLPPIVDRPDINRVVSELVRLRNNGVFDIFAENPGDPIDIVNTWEQVHFLDSSTASALRARLLQSTGELALASQSETSELLRGFDSVRLASKEYWTQEASTRVDRRVVNGLDPQKRQDYIYQMDALGFVAGFLLGGGGIGGAIGGFAASWAFMEVPPADDDTGWNCSDYCVMA